MSEMFIEGRREGKLKMTWLGILVKMKERLLFLFLSLSVYNSC